VGLKNRKGLIKMGFYDAINDELLEGSNVSVTENGAIGYRTTGKNLLDLNFAVASLRFASDEDIIARFKKAFFEDKMLAMKWLFFARDIRGGLGERRLFRTAMRFIADYDPSIVINLIPLIAEYGRFDDLWEFLEYPEIYPEIIDYIRAQLLSDIEDRRDGNSISLLAKWLPSVNASSARSKKYSRMICNGLGTKVSTYRKTLSSLRRYLNVVEQKMSAGEWRNINYEAVPSRANLIYKDAFLRHDEKRRRKFLSALERGEAKINSAVLYPHDIVHKYMVDNFYRMDLRYRDEAIEAMWKSLPDMVKGGGNTIVVADGSGSMCCKVGDGNSSLTALEVADALAIYFAEHSSGEFRNKYITFSEHPQLVDFSKASSLHDKLNIALSHNEVANTNIEAVFDLILKTAVSNHMRQDEIPANILIISDMEFDGCACTNDGYCWGGLPQNLFKTIEQKYIAAGYKLPRLVFWNVNSRTNTIPVRENDMGVALVSGFSVNICKMIMSGKTDPYECLLETINSERYQPVEDVLKENKRVFI